MALLTGMTCAGCGGGTTTTARERSGSGATTCAAPYVFTTARESVTAGNCAAVISLPHRTLTLTVGERLHVAILRDRASPGAGFPVPMPSAPVLDLIAHRPGNAVYRAVQRGRGKLVVHSRFCGQTGNRVRRCAVLRVRVR